jgi:hypothetical protein
MARTVLRFLAASSFLIARNGILKVESGCFAGTVLSSINLASNQLKEFPEFSKVKDYLEAEARVLSVKCQAAHVSRCFC